MDNLEMHPKIKKYYEFIKNNSDYEQKEIVINGKNTIEVKAHDVVMPPEDLAKAVIKDYLAVLKKYNLLFRDYNDIINMLYLIKKDISFRLADAKHTEQSDAVADYNLLISEIDALMHWAKF